MVWYVVLCTVGALLLVSIAVVLSIVERLGTTDTRKIKKNNTRR